VAASTGLDGILGLDTATADTVVAVVGEQGVVAEHGQAPSAAGQPRHAAALLEQVALALEAGGGWDSIGLIAVGVGPGMFTGLRVGVATARGLAQARGLPVAPVGSLAALARGMDGAGSDGSRPRLTAIDARRGEVFAALHEPDGRVRWAPFVAAPDAVADRLSGLEQPPIAAGDGSLRFRAQFEAVGVEVLHDADPAHRMAARNICALAGTVAAKRPELVNPIYLRRPDAEVWRERGNRDPDTRG
jgi:tRNA threonylcarbamoyladenosine biosynthesis protein TsaB